MMNNKKTAGNIQMVFTLIIVSLIALFVCSLTVDVFIYTWLQWLSALLAIVTVYVFMQGGYFYFEMDVKEEHLEVKFYNAFPFSRTYKMLRIPIAAFVNYKISGTKFFRRKLEMFQMSSGQMAKYPPIFITAFSNKDIDNLKKFYHSLK